MSIEEELKEGVEHAHKSGERGVGLTMAIVAVLLAIATLLGHRAHTEEGLLQGKIVDQWDFYQAKHGRAHLYGGLAEIAALSPDPRAKDLALKNYKKSLEEECGTPAEHGCSSPAKDSAILRQLLAPTPSANEEKEGKPDQENSAKQEDSAKSPGKEASSEAKEGHESKPAAHKPGAVNIQEDAKEIEHERDVMEQRANYYDGAELFLEISIVLCSIALLAEMKLFWQVSFISTILGVAVALWGMVGIH